MSSYVNGIDGQIDTYILSYMDDNDNVEGKPIEEPPIDDESVFAGGGGCSSLMASVVTSSSGDASTPKFETIDSTRDPEVGPLGDSDVMELALLILIDPTKGESVYNSFGKLVCWLDPLTTTRKIFI